MEGTKLTVKIFQQEYRLTTKGPESKALQAAALVDEKMHQLAGKKGPGAVSPNKLAVWTALDLAAQLLEAQERYERLLNTVREGWKENP